ncbi:TPA: sugar transferase, partial [Clostridioides difficile]|nr:sugar transferase [Clostridioides difficile]
TPYDKLKLDLNYIQNYSLMLDVKLIILTVKILFMKESTEGIAKEQSTAKLIRSNEKAHEKVEG